MFTELRAPARSWRQEIPPSPKGHAMQTMARKMLRPRYKRGQDPKYDIGSLYTGVYLEIEISPSLQTRASISVRDSNKCSPSFVMPAPMGSGFHVSLYRASRSCAELAARDSAVPEGTGDANNGEKNATSSL